MQQQNIDVEKKILDKEFDCQKKKDCFRKIFCLLKNIFQEKYFPEKYNIYIFLCLATTLEK